MTNKTVLITGGTTGIGLATAQLLGAELPNKTTLRGNHTAQDSIHITTGNKNSCNPVVTLITTTSKLGRFFREIGRPGQQGANGNPPSPDQPEHFVQIGKRFGYRLATPEENAAAGIPLS